MGTGVAYIVGSKIAKFQDIMSLEPSEKHNLYRLTSLEPSVNTALTALNQLFLV